MSLCAGERLNSAGLLKGMIVRAWGIVATLLLLCPLSLLASDKPCSANPLVRGKPFVVHGRLSVYNGNPVARIQVIGTRRLLGVSDGRFYRKGYANLPPSLRSSLDFETDVYGDFEVYPFTASKPGVMQLVCVEQVQHQVMRKARK
jgi:hypothetical protein